MPYISLNPATSTTLKTYPSWDSHRLAEALQDASRAQHEWSRMAFGARVERMNRAAVLFHERVDE